MKTILDKTDRDELIGRIRALNDSAAPRWGKMNVYQMLKHCTLCEEMYLGEKKYPRVLLGRIIGRIALRGVLDPDRDFQRNAPTNRGVIVKETVGNIAAEKDKWVGLIEAYADFSTEDYVHWFFGKMTKEQIGQLVYKHDDHHLRQFNV